MPEVLTVDTVGEPVQVQCAPAQVGDRQVRRTSHVAEQVALGHRLPVVAWREEHLVEVGDPQPSAEHVPLPARAEVVQRGEGIVVDGIGLPVGDDPLLGMHLEAGAPGHD